MCTFELGPEHMSQVCLGMPVVRRHVRLEHEGERVPVISSSTSYLYIERKETYRLEPG